MWQGAGHIAGAAAAIAVIVPQTDDDRTRLLDYYDLGQATYAITLAAADLGIGTGHASVGDQDAARKILGGVPADQDVAFLIGIGYPGRPAPQAARPAQPPPGRRGRSATATGNRRRRPSLRLPRAPAPAGQRRTSRPS